MTENGIASIIVDAALRVHRTLGPGLLESVYEAVLKYELQKRDLRRSAARSTRLLRNGQTGYWFSC